MNVKKALEVPISNSEFIAVKLANKKASIPYISGPSPLANKMPVRKEKTALAVLPTIDIPDL